MRIGERRNSAKAKPAKGKKIERKRAEEALRESEEKFRSIFEKAVDGILIADVKDKKFIDGNKAISQMLGYSLEEIKNLGVMDIHPEEDLPYVIEQFEKQTKGEITLAKDIPVKRKDGTVFYADINSIPVTLDKKRCLMGIFRDITERKRADETLRESEVRYRTLVSNIPGAVYRAACDPEKWTIHFFSDAIQEISGYPHSDFIGDKVRTYKSIIHLDDEKMVEKIVLDCVGKKEPFELEYRIVCADGSIRWVHDRGQGVFDKKGELLWLDGVVIDITERKRAEEEIKKAEEEKLEANKRRIEELEKLYDAAVGRELEMVELKDRIRALELKLREITGK